MRRSLLSAMMLTVAVASASGACAEQRPSLDDVLSETLHGRSTVIATANEGKLCRTLTDMGRRSRRASVCMDPQGWAALIAAAKSPSSLRPANRPPPVRVAYNQPVA